MNILLNGYLGFMGREVVKLADEGYRSARIVAGVDINANATSPDVVFKSFEDISTAEGIDCIIDFSHHSCVFALLDYAKAAKLPVVVCTTGHTEDELAYIRESAKQIPIFFSANMSLGVALLVELAKKAVAAMPEANIEIIEKHHNRKIDAPSGTALMIANALIEERPEAYTNLGRSGLGKRTQNEIGIHAIRMGNIVGEHEVIIGTNNQTITLKHEAHSRALFAEGALAAADFLCGMPEGIYDMKSLLSETKRSEALSAT